MKYRYIFGSFPLLSSAELESVLKNYPETPDLIKILGGTVKIAEEIDKDLALSSIITGDFGISDLTGKVDILKLCKEIKAEVGKVRYVLPKRGERQLSSVVVAKQKLTEIIIGDGYIAKTVAVFDFEDWGMRDYGRPEADAHIGMLPPKVARIMVNLSEGKSIYDPFCGVGTVLAEALMVGCTVIGSDINKNQVAKSQKNLDWLAKTYNLVPSNYTINVGDAKRACDSKVDAIVTEPDMGLSINDAPRLEVLYSDCFASWRQVLNKGGRVVIAFPHYVKNVVDKVKSMGYILEQGPFEYYRPDAKVRRNICVFKYGTC